MAHKQNLGKDLSLSIIDNNAVNILEQEEVMKLTEVSKACKFTCRFCLKKFATPQAMGGHQNAHQKERLEEKRFLVRDQVINLDAPKKKELSLLWKVGVVAAYEEVNDPMGLDLRLVLGVYGGEKPNLTLKL